MHKVLKILIFSSIFYNFAAMSLGPIYALFVANIGGGAAFAGYAYAVYAAAVGILIFVFGRIEDKLNKRKVFILGRALNFVGIVGYLFVQEPLHLFGVQAILGISVAMMNPTFEALYSRGVRRGHEAFEWSVWEGSINMVIAAAAVVGGTIVSLFGFKYLFVMMSIFSFISLMIATSLLKQGLWNQLHKIHASRRRTIIRTK